MLRKQTRNYLWNYSPRLNCAYIEIPKVCCTTIKGVMQSVEYDVPAQDLSIEKIHNRKNSPLLNFDQLCASGTTDYRTFTFVRNPYTRIYSAYKDKLVDNQWEKKRRAETLGFKPDEDISFLDFLSVIHKQAEQTLDIHWLPQTTILEGREIDLVGRFEQFDNDYFIIASALGLPTQMHSRVGHATGTGNSILRSLDPEEIRLVNEIYREDFNALGYLILD